MPQESWSQWRGWWVDQRLVPESGSVPGECLGFVTLIKSHGSIIPITHFTDGKPKAHRG